MSAFHWATSLVLAAVVALTGCTTNASSGAAAAEAYVGSKKCGDCHAKELASWKDTYHAKMVRPASDAMLPDAIDHWAVDGKGNAGPTTGNIDGKRYELADVQMVVGSKWKQRYLVKNAVTGNHQFLDKQWNSYMRVWESYGQKNDLESQCTTCHAAEGGGPRTAVAGRTGASDKDVGCEGCHGPGAAHVATGRKADIVNPRSGELFMRAHASPSKAPTEASAAAADH